MITNFSPPLTPPPALPQLHPISQPVSLRLMKMLNPKRKSLRVKTIQNDGFLSRVRPQKIIGSICLNLELFLATGWLQPSWFHLKVLLFHQDSHAERLQDLLGCLPVHFHPFDPLCVGTEMCTLPLGWLGHMPRLTSLGADLLVLVWWYLLSFFGGGIS